MLIYSPICSLDGYVADEHGSWDWSIPSDEVHAAVNDIERRISTMILGRRTYEVLAPWETMDVTDASQATRDFATGWHATDKVVVSRTLETVSTARTRIVRAFEPDLVSGACSIGGPTLAAEAFRAGLVDEVHLFVSPVVVGGGLRALPDGVRLDLELTGERRLANGVVQLSYGSCRQKHA
jgi:dihydrofolate reductase